MTENRLNAIWKIQKIYWGQFVVLCASLLFPFTFFVAMSTSLCHFFLCCHVYSFRFKLEPLVRGELGYNTGRAVVSLEMFNTTSSKVTKKASFTNFLSEWIWKRGSLSLSQQQLDVRLARVTLRNNLTTNARGGAQASFDDICVRVTYYKVGELLICASY